VGELIIAGKAHKVDAPLVNFYQSGWNATTERCVPVPGHSEGYGCIGAYGERAKNRNPRRYWYRPRLRQYKDNPPLDATRSVIRKFVLHHDGCFNAKMCWNVLHNERGLSCHFIIDNDGTIYQTLDLALMGYHAAEFNPDSIGVEFCNRGDAKKEPDYYSRKGLKRAIKPCKINGHTILSYDFTPEQYDSFNELCRALMKYLPNIPVEFPQDPRAPGQQAWGTLDWQSAWAFNGYIAHYHLTNQKWDPGPFDIKTFCKGLRGTFCMPLFADFDPKRPKEERPEIPEGIDELRSVAKNLYLLNEDRADGGFFPVGPWGEARLWHGGIHLTGTEGQPIYAPFPGRIMVGRMGAESEVGSNNFVLLRHDMALGEESVRFWTLYMHLADELGAAPAALPEWMTKDGPTGWKTVAQPGAVVLIDEPVEAGTLIGHMGSAGPADLRRPQLHLAVFSSDPLFEKIPNAPWELVDGTSGGRFCDDERITKLIDKNRDGKLSRSELATFYKSGGAQQFHAYMTYHVSEWTFEPSWHDALRSTADFRAIKPKELDRMIDEQIIPGLWWTDDVATHAGLPASGEVVHYHPVKFLHWFNEKIVEAVDVVDQTVDANEAVEATSAGMVDDFGDVAGEHALSATDEDDDRCDKAIDLKDMVQGFDAPPPPGCGQ
jgi:murein DD-endopeptidase MepM/ murein hydrolase activator NlpD